MPRSRPAPTWSASCSFRRRRAHLGFEAARALGERVQGPRREGRAHGRCRRRDARRHRRGAEARHAAAARQGDAGARRARASALRPAGDEGAADRDRRPISPRSGSMPSVADRLLFDARAPRRRRGRAGSASRSTGTCWRSSTSQLPFMLSGGLDAGNVAEALRITRAPAGRCVLRRRERARREGPRQDPRLHPRRARHAQELPWSR